MLLTMEDIQRLDALRGAALEEGIEVSFRIPKNRPAARAFVAALALEAGKLIDTARMGVEAQANESVEFVR
jgi:hypothetical protein